MCWQVSVWLSVLAVACYLGFAWFIWQLSGGWR